MLRKFVNRGEFAKNVLTLMTGTVIAQGITIAVSPLLTRLYTPDDFGVFGIYIAVVSIVASISSGRYEMAIMLPKKNEDAVNLLTLSVIISFFVSLLLFLFVIIFQNPFISFILSKFHEANESELRLWLFIMPLAVFLIALYQIFNYWSTRQKTFQSNAVSRISQSSAYSFSALGFGYLSFGSIGLIIGNVLGYLVAFISLFYKAFKGLILLTPFVSRNAIKDNAKKYKIFPTVNVPHALLGSFQEHGIVFFITYFFQLSAVGFYSFTNRIMHVPVSIIGSSMYQVFYQKATQLYNENVSIRPLLIEMYKKTTLIALPIFLIVFFTAPRLFSLIFGEEWLYAGEIAQIMVPWIFLNFIGNPVSALPIITNNQKKAILIAVVDFSLRIIAITIGGILGNFKIAVLLMSVFCSMVLLFALVWFYKIADKKTND